LAIDDSPKPTEDYQLKKVEKLMEEDITNLKGREILGIYPLIGCRILEKSKVIPYFKPTIYRK